MWLAVVVVDVDVDVAPPSPVDVVAGFGAVESLLQPDHTAKTTSDAAPRA
jgi:Ni,Fe-hydrogenase III small subunit